jgi:hypothetical protein
MRPAGRLPTRIDTLDLTESINAYMDRAVQNDPEWVRLELLANVAADAVDKTPEHGAFSPARCAAAEPIITAWYEAHAIPVTNS